MRSLLHVTKENFLPKLQQYTCPNIQVQVQSKRQTGNWSESLLPTINLAPYMQHTIPYTIHLHICTTRANSHLQKQNPTRKLPTLSQRVDKSSSTADCMSFYPNNKTVHHNIQMNKSCCLCCQMRTGYSQLHSVSVF